MSKTGGKTMKKALTAFLAFAMVLLSTLGSLSTATAAPTINPSATGSITVTKLENDPDVAAVTGTGLPVTGLTQTRIAGVTYKIVQTHKVDTNGNVVALTASDTPYTATGVTGDGTGGTTLGVYTFGTLPLGRYTLQETDVPDGYVIDSTVYEIDVPLFDSTGTLVSGPVYDVYVYPKNGTFDTTKEQRESGESATYTSGNLDIQVGDTIDYKITTALPQDITTTSYATIKVSDTLDSRLTLVPSTAKLYVVNAAGTTVATLTTPTGSGAGAALSGTLTLTASTTSPYTYTYVDGAGATQTLAATDKLVLEFTAQVNSTAGASIATDIENQGTIEFENSNGDKSTTTTPKTVVELEEGTATINKVDSVTGDPLGGAVFTLYRVAVAGDLYYATPPATETITVDGVLVTVYNMGSATTNATTGIATWTNLPTGTYYAVETAAPTGYNKLVEPVKMGTLDSATTTGTTDSITTTVEVQNVEKGKIPATGGIGTIVFTIVGVGLMAIAVLVLRKKKVK